MKKFKIMGIFLLSIFTIGTVYGKIPTGEPKYPGITTYDDTPSIDSEVLDEDPMGTGSNQESNKFIGILQLPQPTNYTTSLGYAMALIQIITNRLLGMLAVVTLVYILYCGFLVFSSGSDDKQASQGKSGLKTACIALCGIGLAWFIISAIIRFINRMADKGMG